MNSIVISLDVELGWGFHDRTDLPTERLRTARRNRDRLLSLFDERDIATTWAIVGHLLLETCVAEHADHPAGTRCCSRASDGLEPEDVWFGDGLLESIRSSDVDHELASHGFTHVRFDHERMDRQFAATEIRESVAAGWDRDLSLDSFVFPVNRVGYRDLLADHGFTCYRGTRPARPGRARKLIDAVLDRGSPPIVHPSVDEYGLVNVPASCNLYAFEGWARSLVEPVQGDPIANGLRRGIERLVTRDGLLHLWFHPHDLTRDRKFDRLRTVLDAVDRARDRSEVHVETMGEVAARVASAADAATADTTTADTATTDAATADTATDERGGRTDRG